MARRQSILDATSLVRGGGSGLPGTDQGRELTLRGTIVKAPSSTAEALHVVTEYDAVQGYEVPAGHWSARGEALPAEGDECLIVFDEQGDVWVPVWNGPYGFPGLIALIGALEVKLADSGWIEPALLNSWTNQPAGRAKVAYRKIGNVVRLRGSLFGGAEGSEAFNLPLGFRPPADLFPAGGGFSTVGAPCAVVVKSTGGVVIFRAASATQASVDGIDFTID